MVFTLSTDLGSQQRTHGLLFRALALLWPGVLGLSPAAADLVELVLRKTAHVLAYLVFGLLVSRALSEGARPSAAGSLGALAVAAAYAASDEVHQSFVGTRTAAAGDVAIDAMGALLGITLYAVWAAASQRRRAACGEAP